MALWLLEVYPGEADACDAAQRGGELRLRALEGLQPGRVGDGDVQPAFGVQVGDFTVGGER